MFTKRRDCTKNLQGNHALVGVPADVLIFVGSQISRRFPVVFLRLADLEQAVITMLGQLCHASKKETKQTPQTPQRKHPSVRFLELSFA